jgi:Ca-activated chloride channel family protein
MKQIILITDGCSNSGSDPVAAASQASYEGVTVNVVGILDEGHLGAQGAREVAEIAEAGGGMSRVVYARQLSQTMQMMTRQTVAHTIQKVVNRQLQDLFGKPKIEQLPPQQKAAVVEVMDTLQETSPLKIALLVDTSLSMKSKLRDVSDAIADLVLNLRARQGKSELCVFHFPGANHHHFASMLMDWSTDLVKVSKLFTNIESKGITPTGPALLQTLDYVCARESDERAIWSEYVV